MKIPFLSQQRGICMHSATSALKAPQAVYHSDLWVITEDGFHCCRCISLSAGDHSVQEEGSTALYFLKDPPTEMSSLLLFTLRL